MIRESAELVLRRRRGVEIERLDAIFRSLVHPLSQDFA